MLPFVKKVLSPINVYVSNQFSFFVFLSLFPSHPPRPAPKVERVVKGEPILAMTLNLYCLHCGKQEGESLPGWEQDKLLPSSQQTSVDTGNQQARSCLELKRNISNIKKRNPRKTLLFKLHIILKGLPFKCLEKQH